MKNTKIRGRDFSSLVAGQVSEEDSGDISVQWRREADPGEPREQGAVRLLAGCLDLETRGALRDPGGRRGGVSSLVQSCGQHVAGKAVSVW